jgi:hypothetical protein
MIMPVTFCCLACRLLQDPAPNCVECDSHLIAALATEKTLLVQRGFEPKPQLSGWRLAAAQLGVFAGYAAVIAGAVAWLPVIPIAAGVGAATAGVVAWRRRGVLATMPALEPAIGKAAVAHTGVAHKLDSTIDSLVDGAPALVEETTLALRGRVIFRRVRAVPFLLELDGGQRAVVAGVVRAFVARHRQPSPARNPRLAELGIPANLRPRGELETSTIRDGDTITVTGESSVEIVPELAFHRDAGETTVIRGRAGSVALIA